MAAPVPATVPVTEVALVAPEPAPAPSVAPSPVAQVSPASAPLVTPAPPSSGDAATLGALPLSTEVLEPAAPDLPYVAAPQWTCFGCLCSNFAARVSCRDCHADRLPGNVLLPMHWRFDPHGEEAARSLRILLTRANSAEELGCRRASDKHILDLPVMLLLVQVR